MKGKHYVEIIDRNLHYKIVLFRNITIIAGDSGTGKSSFRKFIQKYRDSKGKVQFTVNSSVPVLVLDNTWEDAYPKLNRTKNTIVVVDENADYIRTKVFAEAIKSSSNYFMLIVRFPIRTLPYSYKSVFKFETRFDSGVYVTETKELFNNGILNKITKIITEDSNSGHDMLKACYRIVEDSELSGNSNLLSRIENSIQTDVVLAIADGAALGPYIEALKSIVNAYNGRVILWAPESFEYLLLTSGIVYRGDVPSILEAPENQIESSLFPSWERFFTWLVMDITSKYTGHEYTKGHLKAWYMTKENIDKFKSVIPQEIKDLLN